MKDLSSVKHVHMIAICGTAMGALAGMLIKSGFRVTGSDESVYPPMSDYLESLGIDIMKGFKEENLNSNPDLVIVGNTVKAVNPEAQEMIRRGLPYLHLPGTLSEFFLKPKHPVVVGGTHGKTTTTSLCTWLLHSAKRDPGFLVGGILKNFGANAGLGEGDFFVIEGDEYDSAYFDKVPKFWHYRPKTAIITSVEFDHGDIYRDLNHVKEAFSKFVSLIPSDGYLVACADYENVLDVIKGAGCPVVTYGFSKTAKVKITDLVLSESGAEFSLKEGRKKALRFRIPLWGAHNAQNAAAAAIVALHHGLSSEEIQRGFDTFAGIKRRQEIVFEENDIIVIDDFAHHPTKVRETVKAVRARYKDRRLIAIFEPRTNTSRRKFFQDIYPASFDGADKVIVAGVYNPGQIEDGNALNPEALAAEIAKRNVEAGYICGVDEIVNHLRCEIRKGDVVLIMSNGGFGNIYGKLSGMIQEKFSPRPVPAEIFPSAVY